MENTLYEPKKYSASMDSYTIVPTVGLLVITALLVYNQIKDYLFLENPYSIYIIAILLGVLFLAFALKPKSYLVTNDELIIKRLLSDICIPKSQILSVEPCNSTEIGWLYRIFGIGGYFGYTGKYYGSKIGWLNIYATRKDKRVLIKFLNRKPIIITPDDYVDFIKTFHNH